MFILCGMDNKIPYNLELCPKRLERLLKMKRNPINVLSDSIHQISCIAEFAFRLAIITARLLKFEKIDLRKYRGDPEKKERIKKIIDSLKLQQFNLYIQMLIIGKQPIQTHTFEKGCIVSESGNETIIN